MSFSSLKTNKSSVFNKLQKELEKTTKVGTVDERFWKLTTDKAGNGFAIIRFLPAGDGEDMPFAKLYSHAFQGPGGWYIENSLTTVGKKDPLGEYNRELWNSGDESLKDQVRKQKRKLSYYSNIYVVKDPGNPENEGKVFLFRYGKKIHDKIMDVVNGDELEGTEGINPFDFWSGANFKLRAKKVAGYPNYDSSEFQAPCTLEDLDDAQLESIWNRQHKLQEIVAPEMFKSYEQLQERLNMVLNLKGGQRTETVTETLAAKPDFSDVTNMNLKPAAVPVQEGTISTDDQPEGEEDVMDYFRKLADS
tara:strand:- start:1055 stop:1972 length:918 start_codon:yes stop_codon:yes gene_type:complete